MQISFSSFLSQFDVILGIGISADEAIELTTIIYNGLRGLRYLLDLKCPLFSYYCVLIPIVFQMVRIIEHLL
jgi:hypothetical protein